MNLHINSQLQNGKYRIEKVLGQGGFGITYLAMQVGLNRKVAIKEFFMKEYCNRDEATSSVSLGTVGSREVVMRFREKFIKEAQNIAVLNHPHIIRIYDVFEENNTAYYVMEYLDNASLSDYLKQKGRLPEQEAVRFIKQIADALAYIHEHKINHLDVKPGNILLDNKNNAVLIDFGLAKRYDEAGHQTSTTPVGISHGYAPLEQYKQGGVGTFSPTTDIYSLAATLYKLVTGQTPPDAGDVNEDGLPDFPSDISQSTINAITQAMQGSRKNRPQSIADFLKLLDGEGVKTQDDDEATEIVGVERPKPTEPKKEEPKQELPNEQKPKKKKSKAWIFILLAIIIGGAGYYFVNDKMKGEKKKEAEMLAQAEQERIKKEQEAAHIAQAQKEAEAKAKAEAEKKRLEAEKKKKEQEAAQIAQAQKEAEAKRKAEQERLEKERQELEAEKAELEAQKAEQARLEREAAEKAKYNGHEYVDLGLSVKWATCNVGANKPEDYGDYFAWGEISTKSEYTEESSTAYEKLLGDIKGDNRYDAATANWGGNWRLPTKAEFEELKNSCTWQRITINGKNGYKVTGPNGNSIFLPAAGSYYESSLYNDGNYGLYWSSESDWYWLDYDIKEHTACYFGFNVSECDLVCHDFCIYGMSIRPVTDGRLVKDGHEYVDLGLSVKWATCNVGANKPEDYGNYYAWGETSTKSTYLESNSKTNGKQMSDIKGNSQYDAARANWGGTWRLPTKAELKELNNKCTWKWTTQNGVNGYKVTGPNGNSIFLPAAGHRDWSSLEHAGEYGRYCSSTPNDSDSEYFLNFGSGGHNVDGCVRRLGISVRPVSE